MTLSTCRFCRQQETRPLVKYNVRHYAHTKCLVAAKGEEFLLGLPSGALGAVEVRQVSKQTLAAITTKIEAPATPEKEGR